MTDRKIRCALAALSMIVVTSPTAAFADDFSLLSSLYVRGEAGAAFLGENRGYWRGPGAGAERVTFSLNDNTSFTGMVGIGSEVIPGVRGDLSLGYLSEMQVQGRRIAPSGIHADHQKGDVSSWQVMANIFVEPLTLAGQDFPINPFITGGLGVSFNKMGEWTRRRDDLATSDPDYERSFTGATSTEFAWSIGGGVTAELNEIFGFSQPVYLDLTYRYMDLGKVKGGYRQTDGNGPSPRESFNFDLVNHVATVGVRIPFSMN
ncbi:outer membrane protein [Roseibium sp.]|uniref:outer membrane protein n=1 Tax=Roseibium sp. TaxID=1936156 RepID=UPI003A978AA7